MKSRFGGEHSYNEYISLTADLKKCQLFENGLTVKCLKQESPKDNKVPL